MTGAPKPEHPNDRAVYLIYFDDQDVKPMVVVGEVAARAAFARVSLNWNAHLFAKIESNTRDDRHHGANIDVPRPEITDAEQLSKLTTIRRALDVFRDAEHARLLRLSKPDKAAAMYGVARIAARGNLDDIAAATAWVDAAIRAGRSRNG